MAESRKNKLDHYECDGQLSIFDFIKPVCNYSGHTCNKAELWKVADTLDDLMCPHVCCRKCNTKMCGARCNGSQEPEPFMNEPVYELDIRGFMDDPYCPQCDYAFITYGANNETDCERCPRCHVKVDWGRWHFINDEES